MNVLFTYAIVLDWLIVQYVLYQRNFTLIICTADSPHMDQTQAQQISLILQIRHKDTGFFYLCVPCKKHNVMCDKNSNHIVNTLQKLTLNTARMMRVTFSLTESLRMFANIGMILDLKQNTIPHSTFQSIIWPVTVLKSGMATADL